MRATSPKNNRQKKQISKRSNFVHRLNHTVFNLVAVSVLGVGFVPASQAGIIKTQGAVQNELHLQRLDELKTWLAREDVAGELVALGVDPVEVMSRVRNMTDAEIAMLHGKIENQVAGGDALAVIGAVFLVLLILEVVGVTDIFKSI